MDSFFAVKARIDGALRSGASGSDALLLCSATPLMETLGFAPVPVMVTMKHLRAIISPEDPARTDHHGVPVETLARLPEFLEAPVLVVSGKRAAYLFFSPVQLKGRPLVCVLEPSGRGMLRGQRYSANFLLSAYPMEIDVLSKKIKGLHESEIVYADRIRARQLLARQGISFSHLAGVLSGPSFFAGKIPAKYKPEENRERIEGTFMKKIEPGNIIFVSLKIPELPDTTRYLVLSADEIGNLLAAPLQSESKNPAAEMPVSSVSLKQKFVALDTEMAMSAAWPWVRQPNRLTAAEMKELVQKKAEYAQTHTIRAIQADKPVAPQPDFDKGIQELYDGFRKDPARLAEYLAFSSRFYTYSARNRAMLYMQNRGATFVASRTNWRKMGYAVLPQQLQRGLAILCPVKRDFFERAGEWLPVSAANAQERFRLAEGTMETKTKITFHAEPVYDISQTNCPVEDYPKVYDKGEASPQHSALYEAVVRVATLEGITVTKDAMNSISIGGYYNRADNSIHINALEKDTAAASVMLHEYAHALLHNGSAATLPTEIKEFEAQGTAVMLLKHYGFSVTQQDQDYLVSYMEQAAAKADGFDLQRSFERMGKSYAHAIERIGDQLTVLEEARVPAQLSPVQDRGAIEANFIQDL